MRLVTILVFAVVCCLAASIHMDRFIGKLLDETRQHDVAVVGMENDLLDKILPEIKVRFPIRIVDSAMGSTKRQCSLFFVQPQVIKELSQIPCFNHEGAFVFMFNKDKSTPELLIQTAITLRELGILNAVYVVYDPEDFSVDLLSYEFFEQDHVDLSLEQAIQQLFTPKTINKKDGHRYRIHMKELVPYYYRSNGSFTGLDKQLIEVITTHQNASVEYHTDHPAYVVWLTSQNKLDQKKLLDFSLRRLHLDNRDLIDKVYLPEWDELCIVVPKRQQRLLMLQLTQPFEYGVWILLVVFILVRFFCRRFTVRLLVLTFVLFEFLLTEGYLAKAIQFLTDMRYVPDPSTLAELIEAGEEFVMHPGEREAFGGFVNVTIHLVKEKEEFIGRYSMVALCKTAEMTEHSVLNVNPLINDKLIFTLKDRFRPYPSYYEFAKYHPFKAEFQQQLRRIFETGIWRKIFDCYSSEEAHFQTMLTPHEYPISFEDLYSLWIVLVIGWIISALSYLIEILVKRLG